MTSAAFFLVWVYIVAGIPFAVVHTTLAGMDTDVRAAGSGNPGATNVARLFGWRMAAPVLAADIGKGFVPVVLARLLWPDWDPWFAWVVAGVAFSGHCWSMWLEFRGGKGVATAAGTALAITPLPTLLAALLWVLTLGALGRSSVASLTAALALVAGVSWLDPRTLPYVVLLAAGIAWTHVANVRRLLRGEEKTIVRPVRWGRPREGVERPEAALEQGPGGGAPATQWKERRHDPLEPTDLGLEPALTSAAPAPAQPDPAPPIADPG